MLMKWAIGDRFKGLWIFGRKGADVGRPSTVWVHLVAPSRLAHDIMINNVDANMSIRDARICPENQKTT